MNRLTDLVMVFFVVLVRVPLLLWTLLIASTSSDEIKGNLTDTRLITNFLRKIVIPFLETNQFFNGKLRENPADDKMLTTQVEKAIRQKVMKLKPMLQDREHLKIKTKINVKLDENDKTTILELMSENNRKSYSKSSLIGTQQETETLDSKIEKYKQIRQQITFLLHKEKASHSTSKLITRTLDDMLALLIERKCHWENLNTADVTHYLLKNLGISEGQYKLMCYLRPGKPDIHISTDHGQPEHSAHMKSSDKTIVRKHEMKDKNLCDPFIVCSEELTDFLKNTYHNLNNTTVSTFTDFGVMYDIEENKSVKGDVSTELEYLSNSAKMEVNQIFLQELEHFTLDENKDKTQNIAHLKNFIKTTAAHIKSSIDRLVGDELGAKRKLYLTMKDDLSVNLRMNMDNLSRLLETNICRFFVLCSQEQTIRRHAMKPKKNSYVEVTRNTVRSIATMEGVFSSEKGSTDKFFK